MHERCTDARSAKRQICPPVGSRSGGSGWPPQRPPLARRERATFARSRLPSGRSARAGRLADSSPRGDFGLRSSFFQRRVLALRALSRSAAPIWTRAPFRRLVRSRSSPASFAALLPERGADRLEAGPLAAAVIAPLGDRSRSLAFPSLAAALRASPPSSILSLFESVPRFPPPASVRDDVRAPWATMAFLATRYHLGKSIESICTVPFPPSEVGLSGEEVRHHVLGVSSWSDDAQVRQASGFAAAGNTNAAANASGRASENAHRVCIGCLLGERGR